MSLAFSLALGCCKRILAWIRVLVLSSKSLVLCTQRNNHKVFFWGITFKSSLAKGFYKRVTWIRVLAVSSARRVVACTKELVQNHPWFPNVQERSVLTGKQALATTDSC